MGRVVRAVNVIRGAVDDVSLVRLFTLAILVSLIILHGLLPSAFIVDGTTVALVAVVVVVVLVPILESATLPGGAGVKLRPKLDRLQREAEAVSEAVATGSPTATITQEEEAAASRPPTLERTEDRHGAVEEAPDEQLIARVLDETSRSPKVGLMLLASELERAARQLLAGTGWGVAAPDRRSLPAIVQRLVQMGVMPASLPSAVDLFMSVRNDIVHGRGRVADDDILRAVDAGLTILKAIEAIPREHHVVMRVDVPIFQDERLTQSIDDAVGVMLRSRSPGGATSMIRIFPTTQKHFRVGEEVAWEWNVHRQWGPAWYEADDGSAVSAWNGSAEFIGRNLSDV